MPTLGLQEQRTGKQLGGRRGLPSERGPCTRWREARATPSQGLVASEPAWDPTGERPDVVRAGGGGHPVSVAQRNKVTFTKASSQVGRQHVQTRQQKRCVLVPTEHSGSPGWAGGDVEGHESASALCAVFPIIFGLSSSLSVSDMRK